MMDPIRPDTLGSLATAEDCLSRATTGPTAAEMRLRRLIAAHEAQVEKLLRPWVRHTAATRNAVHYLVARLAELNAALAEVESYELAGFRAVVSEARGHVSEARRFARVDTVLADQFRRDGGTMKAVV